MGQIAYGQTPQYYQNDNKRVGFFGLRDDGDEAIVRILHDTPATFDIVAVHQYPVDGRVRNINCIRDPRDPVDKCPLCEAGEPLRYRFFIHLLEYSKDDQGNIVATPKVWERSLKFADTIKDYCSEYAPLSNFIFKIKRVGKKGSTDTKYNIIPANPSVYIPEMYPKDCSAFENYSSIGTAVYNLDYDGMSKLVYGDAADQYTSKDSAEERYEPAMEAAPKGYYNKPVEETATQRAPAPTYEPPVSYATGYVNETPSAGAPQYEAPPVSNRTTPPMGYGANSPSGEFVRPRRYN